jgi:Mg-chelatase subunit ChlI
MSDLEQEIAEAKKLTINDLQKKVANLGGKGNGKKTELLARYEEALRSRKRKAEYTPDEEPSSKVPKLTVLSEEQTVSDHPSESLYGVVAFSKYDQQDVATMCKLVDRLFTLHKVSTSLEFQQKALGSLLEKTVPSLRRQSI